MDTGKGKERRTGKLRETGEGGGLARVPMEDLKLS